MQINTRMIFTNGIPSWIQIKTVYSQTISQLLFDVTCFSFCLAIAFRNRYQLWVKTPTLSCISQSSCVIFSFSISFWFGFRTYYSHTCALYIHQLISSRRSVYESLYIKCAPALFNDIQKLILRSFIRYLLLFRI